MPEQRLAAQMQSDFPIFFSRDRVGVGARARLVLVSPLRAGVASVAAGKPVAVVGNDSRLTLGAAASRPANWGAQKGRFPCLRSGKRLCDA